MPRRTDEDLRLASEILVKSRAVEAAIRKAVREALLQHKRGGQPIAVWRAGELVWIPPEEIEIPDDPE
jgi:hypothetical protein